MKKIGIVGAGIMGGGHARYLTASVGGARVAAVFDVDTDRAETLATAVGAEVAADARAIIEDPAIDGVVIASPDATHPDLALACIERGVPALVEKPLATDPHHAREVVAAEGDASLLSMGFMRRFDPQHRVLREAVDSGVIGRPRLFRSIHRNPAPAANHSTRLVVTASAIHDIDTARWLLGEFESVTATGRDLDGGPDSDLLLIEGHHRGGGISSIEVFVSAGYGYEVIAEVVAERGVATTLGGELTTTRVRGARTTVFPQIWLDRFEHAYIAELVAWVRSLGGEPFAGARAIDGYRDQVVAEAVIEAVHRGARVPIPA